MSTQNMPSPFPRPSFSECPLSSRGNELYPGTRAGIYLERKGGTGSRPNVHIIPRDVKKAPARRMTSPWVRWSSCGLELLLRSNAETHYRRSFSSVPRGDHNGEHLRFPMMGAPLCAHALVADYRLAVTIYLYEEGTPGYMDLYLALPFCGGYLKTKAILCSYGRPQRHIGMAHMGSKHRLRGKGDLHLQILSGGQGDAALLRIEVGPGVAINPHPSHLHRRVVHG